MSQQIVITGATGNTGQVIVGEFQRRGVPFVALARSATNRAALARAGVATVAGDFDDPASLVRALQGATMAYLVCTPDERLIPREMAFIAAAREAGVRRIVKCSAYWAGVDAATQNLRAHGVIERALVESGLEYTIIRPHGFMQTFTLFGWDLIQKAGVLSLPAGDGALPLVDVRDVAMVAVRALTEPGHVGKVYDVTGAEALTMYQVAEILGRVLGRPVTYLPGDERQFLWVMSLLGVPATPREHAMTIFRFQREHRLEQVLPTLQDLGITPIRYEQFVRDLVAGRTGGGNSFRPPDTLVFRLLSVMMPVMMRLRLRLGGRDRG